MYTMIDFVKNPFIGSDAGVQTMNDFNDLPSRAKQLVFSYLFETESERVSCFFENAIFNCEEMESPIEKIFYVADQIYIHENDDACVNIFPQVEINCRSKKYRVDFLYNNQIGKDFCKAHNKKFLAPDINIVVECDGHEFHQKTKKQVVSDNERQTELQLLGYDVIRFSGTQIYENPLKCVEKVYDFAKMKLCK